MHSDEETLSKEMFQFLQCLKVDGAICYLKFAGIIDFNGVMMRYVLTKCENGFLTLSPAVCLSLLASFPLHNSKYNLKKEPRVVKLHFL